MASNLELQEAEDAIDRHRARIAELAAENERLRALEDLARERNRKLEEALEPFSAMAGEMFVRRWNENNVVIALDNTDEPHRVTAGDFFVAHRALTGGKEDG